MNPRAKEHLSLGRNYLLQKHDPERAIIEFSEAIRLDNACVEAFLARHFAYMRTAQWELAITDANEVLSGNPDQANVVLSRASAHGEMKRWQAAYDDTLVAEDCSDMDEDSYHDALWQRGYYALRLRRWREVINAYSEVLANDSDACAYNNRGLAFEAIGDIDRALDDASKAIEINPGHPDHFNSRARYLRNLGEMVASQEDSVRALDACENTFDPNLSDESLYADRADAYINLERFEEALEVTTKMIVTECDAESFFLHATALRGVGQLREAIDYYSLAIVDEPEPRTFRGRGEAHTQLGNSELAKRDVEHAEEMERKEKLAARTRI